jgi:osmotically-inducible protein OsmY
MDQNHLACLRETSELPSKLVVRKRPLNTADVVREATTRLAENPHLSTARIQCSLRLGTLVLEGHAASYYEKQMAQETVKRLDGVAQVVNQIEVVE